MFENLYLSYYELIIFEEDMFIVLILLKLGSKAKANK